MTRDVLIERFFTALISGDRTAAREIVNECLSADCPAEKVLSRLFWPTLEHIQKLYREDQLTPIAHNFATRTMRQLSDQMQLRLEQQDRRNKRVLLVSGPDESEELSGQIVADMLEADGYDVYFAGGGIANDEVVNQLGELNADVLLVFGAVASTVPFTRLLIDRLHNIGVCPNLQIAVGGGVFSRAEGLAEEIGADVWGNGPEELIDVLENSADRRMTPDQRTVGRKRRQTREAA